MSGESRGYVYHSIEKELCDRMYDPELNDLMKDIADLARAVERYDSGNICRGMYDEKVMEFKKKWFKSDREKRLKQYVTEELVKTRDELFRMIGAYPDKNKK